MTRKRIDKRNGYKIKGSNERMYIQSLLNSSDYLKWDNPTTMRAFVVAKELKTWMAGVVENYPCVSVVVCEAVVAVMVGETCLWNSEHDGIDDLNLENCRKALKEEVLHLAAVFEL